MAFRKSAPDFLEAGFLAFRKSASDFSEVVSYNKLKENMMYERTIAKRVKQMNDTFRVLILTGPRQVGKSTLLESLIPEGMLLTFKKIS